VKQVSLFELGEHSAPLSQRPETFLHAGVPIRHVPPAPDLTPAEREQKLQAALAEAKRQLHALRARVVRASSVAWVWSTVPNPTAAAGRAEAAAKMLKILEGENDKSLEIARREFRQQVLHADSSTD